MNTAKNVTVIPATLEYYSAMLTAQTKRKRVAAYARISTDKAKQITSYGMQIRYYTNYIYSNPSLEFMKYTLARWVVIIFFRKRSFATQKFKNFYELMFIIEKHIVSLTPKKIDR